jgi:hypothetical protein
MGICASSEAAGAGVAGRAASAPAAPPRPRDPRVVRINSAAAGGSAHAHARALAAAAAPGSPPGAPGAGCGGFGGGLQAQSDVIGRLEALQQELALINRHPLLALAEAADVAARHTSADVTGCARRGAARGALGRGRRAARWPPCPSRSGQPTRRPAPTRLPSPTPASPQHLCVH